MSQKRVFNTNAEHIYVNNVPEYNLDFINARSIDPTYNFTRNSSATYVDADGFIKTAGLNAPRFDYDPITGEYKGLLIEDSRTNIITRSESIGWVAGILGSGGQLPTGWSVDQIQAGTQLEIIGGGVEENGLNYVDLRFFGVTTGTNRWLIKPGNFLTINGGTVYTSSVYAKLISGSISGYFCQFSVFGGDGGASLTSINSTLTRYFGSAAESTSRLAFPRFDFGISSIGVTVDATIRLAGFQVEVGSIPTSYIPTNGSAVTRQPDQLVLNKTLNTEGTFFIESNSSKGVLLVADNGSSTLSISQSTDEYTKSVLYYNTNRTLRMSSDNSVPIDLNNYPNQQDLNRVSLGFNKISNNNYINGHIKKFSYYSNSLTEDNLRALTGNKITTLKVSSEPILTNGLVLYLDAGNPESYPGSGTTWIDLSGNGNDGTLVNGVGYDSLNGGSLVFNGITNYVSTKLNQLSTFGSSGFTFNLALNATDDGAGIDVRRMLLGNTSYSVDGFGFGFNHGLSNTNIWNINFYPSVNANNFGNFSPNFGSVEFITFWFDGSNDQNNVRLYRNGDLLSSLSLTGTKTYKDDVVHIGYFAQGGWSPFLGKIYLIQGYNRALTQLEIQQNFNAFRGRFSI